MPKTIFNDNSYTIIGAYYEVYRHSSRTFPENIIESIMIEELRLRGVRATRQDKHEIIYKDRRVGLQQLDLFVADDIVVEIKVAERLTRLHKAQCISYIKTVDKQTGLLLNFGGSDCEFKRLYFNPAKKPAASPPASPPGQPDETWLYPELAYQIVGALYEVHRVLGAGFVHRIYTRACEHELQWQGLAVQSFDHIQVTYKNKVIGDIAFGNLLVEGKIILFPVAIGNLQDIHLNNLKEWMALQEVELGILANFDAVGLELTYLRT